MIYVLLAVAVLASQGAVLILSRWQRKKLVAMTAILALFPLVESFGGPIHYRPAPETPAVYRWLADVPGPVPIVELPLPDVRRQRNNAVYLYWSTTHFKPMANGFAAFVPPVYVELAQTMRSFPDDRGVEALRRLGFHYVIFHRDRYLRSRAEELEGSLHRQPGLRRAYRTPNETVYEILGNSNREGLR
jgi:hypothetical protein